MHQIPCWLFGWHVLGPPHEMVSELVCGAVFLCNLHCKTNPADLGGCRGQAWPKIGQKYDKKLPNIGRTSVIWGLTRAPQPTAAVAPGTCPSDMWHLSGKIETLIIGTRGGSAEPTLLPCPWTPHPPPLGPQPSVKIWALNTRPPPPNTAFLRRLYII